MDRITVQSHDHYRHITTVGGEGGILWPQSLFMAGFFLWIAMASFTFLLKSLSSFTKHFHIRQGVLMACDKGMFCDGRVKMFTICMFLEPHSQCPVSPMYSSLHPPCFMYTSPHCFSFWVLFLGLTYRDLRVLKGL